MSNELSDQEIADALRAKAQKYLKMAEELDGKTVTGMSMTTRVSPPPQFYGGGEAVPTAAAIKDVIKGRGYRIKGLAHYFQTTPEVIKSIVDNPENRLTDKERGWVREI